MNAARFARNLIEDGVDPKIAQPLAEHLADEIDRTVATKEHVEMVVTREVQQLRVEMHQEFQGSMHASRNGWMAFRVRSRSVSTARCAG
jgi:hypothetical protein